MEKNIYSEAARAELLEERKYSQIQDHVITRNRRAGMSGEVFGVVTLKSENKEDSASKPGVFIYEELGLRIDTSEYEYMTKYIARSCRPNCRLQHYFGSKTPLLAFYVVSANNIQPGNTLTLPFNQDWPYSDISLTCAAHPKGDCPVEKRRQQYAMLRSVFRKMGPEKLKEFDAARMQLKWDMNENEKSEGRIVVRGDDIYIGLGKKKAKIFHPETFDPYGSTPTPTSSQKAPPPAKDLPDDTGDVKAALIEKENREENGEPEPEGPPSTDTPPKLVASLMPFLSKMSFESLGFGGK